MNTGLVYKVEISSTLSIGKQPVWIQISGLQVAPSGGGPCCMYKTSELLAEPKAMGAEGSKNGGSSKGAAEGQTAPLALPPQQPYSGMPVEYHTVTMNATLDIKVKMSSLKPNFSFQSTNVDSHYPTLASWYAQGYRMLVFVALPGSTKSYGFAAMGQSQITGKFQGIFRKLFPEEMGQQWELRVEKSMLVNQMFVQWSGNLLLRANTHTGTATDNLHIIQTINNITQNGGRLVSIELTGMAGHELQIQQAHGQYHTTGTMPMMEISVDVFYEVPIHPNSERYVYQIVSCPMVSTFQHSQFNSIIDWSGVMSQYLGTGWKLVEISEDNSVSTMCRQSGFRANVVMNKNCLWIFEKPVSRLEDNTPYYEGTMVEHYFKTKVETHALGFRGADMNVTTDWEPVINHMGQYGWQVVRILETPDVIVRGTFKPTMHTRQLIFFQRKIAGRNEFTGDEAPSASGVTPPAYSDVYPEKH